VGSDGAGLPAASDGGFMPDRGNFRRDKTGMWSFKDWMGNKRGGERNVRVDSALRS